MWTATTASTTSHHAASIASTSAHHSSPVLPTRPTSAAVCPVSYRQQRGQLCIFHRHLQKTLTRTLYWHKPITTCRAGVWQYMVVTLARCWHSDRCKDVFIYWLILGLPTFQVINSGHACECAFLIADLLICEISITWAYEDMENCINLWISKPLKNSWEWVVKCLTQFCNVHIIIIMIVLIIILLFALIE